MAERADAAAHRTLRDWQARMLMLEAHGDRFARDHAAAERSKIDREVQRTGEEVRLAREALALALMKRDPAV